MNHTARNRPFSNLVKRCSVSEDGPVCEGTTAGPPPNEGPVIMPEAAPPLHRRALASLTMHDELSAARIPEEFGSVHMRLQQEWTFNGNFVSKFTILSLNSQLINYYYSI